MNFEYFVVPFFDQAVAGQFTDAAAKQGCETLSNVLNRLAKQGWEYYRSEEVVAHVSPGCLASLFGQRPAAYRYKQLVFRREQVAE